jgi:hypothetical protein
MMDCNERFKPAVCTFNVDAIVARSLGRGIVDVQNSKPTLSFFSLVVKDARRLVPVLQSLTKT